MIKIKINLLEFYIKKGNFLVNTYTHLKRTSNGHIWVGTDNGLVELDKDLNYSKIIIKIQLEIVMYITYMMIQKATYGFVL